MSLMGDGKQVSGQRAWALTPWTTQGGGYQEHEAGTERLKAERAREKLVRMGLIGSSLQPARPELPTTPD